MELKGVDMNKTPQKKRMGGFTILELLIALLLSLIVTAGVYTAYISQVKSYAVQNQVTEMQQNLRAAMTIMVEEIRITGYDPVRTGLFGITDIRPRDIADAVDVTFAGNSALVRTADDGTGANTGNGTLDGDETISFSLFDFPVLAPAGFPDLARNDGSSLNRDDYLLAENIVALGFAYAFDANNDGRLDTYNGGGNTVVIWAFDSDGDNDLDMNLDTDGDGDIDTDDGPGQGGNGLIAGQALADFSGNAIADVAPANICAVRIWVLATTRRPDESFTNTKTYVVGKKVITPNGHYRGRLLTSIVKCRNMGL